MVGATSRSIPDVLQDILANLQGMVRSEIRLAKAELTDEVAKAGRAAGLMAGGVVAAVFTASCC
jgi:hypothetical protein